MKSHPKQMVIGGQAVIEGVMMKSPNYVAVAVRNPQQKITTHVEQHISLTTKPFYRLPFIRGMVSLFEMLWIGMKALSHSAKESADSPEEEMGTGTLIATIAFSIVLALALFVALPYGLTHLIGIDEQLHPFLFNVVDGLLKLSIFFCYVYGLSFMPDMRRVFQYHGAEHKTVHCYEAKKKLTVENVKPYTTLHPRCGTSFLVLVILLGVFVLSCIPLIVSALLPLASFSVLVQKIVLLFARMVGVLPLAGLSYELLRITAKYQSYAIMKIFIVPGLLFQKITTREPDNDQIEVAIAALSLVLEKENIPSPNEELL